MITTELKSTSADDKPLIQVSQEVIEGIFGEESPEKLPKFDENLRFFPPILEAIKTFVYPWLEIMYVQYILIYQLSKENFGLKTSTNVLL